MAQSHVDEAIDLEAEQSEPSTSTHGSSASTKGKSKAGRPAGKSWEGFLKVAKPVIGKSGRKWDGKCKVCGTTVAGRPEKLLAHAVDCKKNSNAAQLAALTKQVEAGSGKASGQQSIASFTDSSKLSKEHNRLLQRMLCLAFIMNAWSFRSVGSVHFVEFLRCIWPSFEPPGQQLAVMLLPLDSCTIHIRGALTVLTFLLTVIQVYRGDFYAHCSA